MNYYDKYLKLHGVKLPKLTDNKGNYTKDVLVLVYLGASEFQKSLWITQISRMDKKNEWKRNN